MKTSDFTTPLTSKKLNENMNKMFGVRVKLENYSREQLEDMRNKLRTRVFQQEGSAGINDLLTNETYQKDKAMLDLLNTRIKEMLGEDIKKLRDKMDQLSESKNEQTDKKALPSMSHIKKMCQDGKSVAEICKMHPDCDQKELKQMVSDCKKKMDEGKKVDQNKDGKNDWEDIKIARMKASGAISKDKEVKEVKMADLPSKTVKGSSYGNQSDYKKPPEDARRPAKTMPAKKDKKPLGEAGKHSKRCDCKECMGTMEGKKPDFLDMDKDGNKKEPMKKAVADKKKNPFGNKKKVKEAFSTFKHNVQFVNESLGYLLQEDEEGKAKAITAAGDMVNDFTSWMQRVGQYQTKTMIELADAIKADFGAQEAEAFKAAVGPALSATLETLTQQREAVSGAVATLAGEATPDAAMGMEPEMPPEPGMDIGAPDAMNPAPGGDEFGAADAAAGMGTTGREMRESKFARKLAESHNIIASLAK